MLCVYIIIIMCFEKQALLLRHAAYENGLKLYALHVFV